MRSLFIRIVLFDPHYQDEEYPVSDGIEVQISKLLSHNPLVGIDPLTLKYEEQLSLFFIDAKNYPDKIWTKNHFFRIGFKKVNFLKD